MTSSQPTSSTAMQAAESTLIELGQWIDSRHWCPATGGNFSHRLEDGAVLITRSGCHKGALEPADLLTVSLDGQPTASASTISSQGSSKSSLKNSLNNSLNNMGKPSAETLLHTAIYQQDPAAKVVLHTHSVNSTVLSRITPGEWLTLSGFEMQKSLTGNTTHEDTVRLAIVENDQDMVRLAELVCTRWAETPLQWGFLVRGHGLYSWGDSPETARQHLEGLEFLFACALEMKKLGN